MFKPLTKTDILVPIIDLLVKGPTNVWQIKIYPFEQPMMKEVRGRGRI